MQLLGKDKACLMMVLHMMQIWGRWDSAAVGQGLNSLACDRVCSTVLRFLLQSSKHLEFLVVVVRVSSKGSKKSVGAQSGATS